MVSAYNKDDAAATFTALAATLEDYASRTEKVKADNGDTSGKAMARNEANTDAPMSGRILEGMSAQMAFLYHDRKNRRY